MRAGTFLRRMIKMTGDPGNSWEHQTERYRAQKPQQKATFLRRLKVRIDNWAGLRISQRTLRRWIRESLD